MASASRTPRARSYDPVKVRAALDGQVRAVRDAVAVLCAASDATPLLAAPSRLEAWTVRQLVVHIAVCMETLPRRLAADPAPRGPTADLDLRGYVNWLGSQAGEIAQVTIAEADDLSGAGEPAELLDRYDVAAARLAEAVADAAGTELVNTRFGRMTVNDFLVTRLLELVVHGDDLTAATGTAISHDRQALAARSNCGCRRSRWCSACRAPGTLVAPRPTWWRPTRSPGSASPRAAPCGSGRWTRARSAPAASAPICQSTCRWWGRPQDPRDWTRPGPAPGIAVRPQSSYGSSPASTFSQASRNRASRALSVVAWLACSRGRW